MFLNIFYPFIKFSLGTLYPAYKTWKSLKRKDETIRRRWMKYWISFSVFQTLEYFADLTIAFVMPFYIEMKISALMWLVHMRASSLIDSAIDKELKRREKLIDSWLKRLHNEFVGVAWYELSRFAINILAAILKSMVTSHIALPNDRLMAITEDCDTRRSNSNSNSNHTESIHVETNNNNNNINDMDSETNTEDGEIISEMMSPREKRYKRERGSLVQSMSID